jgi:NAD(P)-dependent dehydrogenase (short-subunit alcohol dehydrogenase family)
MTYFAGKTAIVTGGASGIGRALCRELARRGVAVTVADINEDGAQAAAREIRETGGKAVAAPLDVTDREAVFALVEQAGRLDFMFNNAGMCIEGEMRDMDFDLWKRIVDINLWGVIHGSAAAYAKMVRQGAGHIVNVASAAGLMPIPTQAAYSMTKFGVVGLTQALRVEGAELGVRVSAVCPGFIDTAMPGNAPVLNVRREDVLDKLPFKLFPPERLAEIILAGIARNRAIIVAPWYVRSLWWGYRLCPTLLELTIGRWAVREFRRLREV